MELEEMKKQYTYVYIIGGRLRSKTTEDDPKAIKRENKTGTIVYEKEYRSISGKITGLHIRENDYGQNINVVINDEGILSISLRTPFAKSFLLKMGEINYEEKIKLSPYDFEAKDEKTNEMKRKRGVTIFQNEEKIKNNYDGVPELEVKTIGKKQEYDDTDQLNHLVNKFEGIAESLGVINKEVASEMLESKEKSQPHREDDDLPF